MSSPTALRRWLDAFVALPDRIKLPLAVFLALLVHALILLVVWVWPLVLQFLIHHSLLPAPRARNVPPPPPRKLELVLVTPTPAPKIPARPTPTPAPLSEQEDQMLKDLFAQLPPERQREYVDVEGLARKKNTTPRALLESWRDSVAGSRKRGDGTDPLPTLDGLENMDFQHLTSQELSMGKAEEPGGAPSNPSAPPPGDRPSIFKPKPVADPAQNTAAATAPTPAPTPPPPRQTAAAKATPPPNVKTVAEASRDEIPIFLARISDPALPKYLSSTRPVPDAPKPQPSATPTPKPEPAMTPVPKPTPAVIAKATPAPMPTPGPRQVAPKPTPEPDSQMFATKTDLNANRPKPVRNPGYASLMRRTKIIGANQPPGEDGVDAVATPLGRYKKAVSSAVGSRWNYYIQHRMSLLQTGKITVVFTIDARGKLRGFRMEENTSNAAHAALVEQCVREAEFDAPPPEALRDGVFEYPMSFHLL